MPTIRAKYDGLSFRGRLLLLLVAVSLLLGVVALFTFNSLLTKPIEQRIHAQLNASLRAMAPVIDSELQSSSERLQSFNSNQQLIDAVEAGDMAAATRVLIDESVEAQLDEGTTEGISGSTTDGEDAVAPTGSDLKVFITDNTGEVIAGSKPDAPLLEQENVTSADLRRGSELLGVLHVPVVLDEQFMRERLGSYVPDAVTVFVANDDELVTEKNTYDRPARLGEGIGNAKFGGKDRKVLVQPVLDGDVVIGAAVPASTVADQRKASFKNLVGFIFALVAIMLVVSFVVTRSVADALAKFAEMARQLAGGDLTLRIPVTGDDEIADLSQSFNEMAENLELRIENLIEARAKMRRQVDLFGEALANATAVEEMLTAVCGLALESTVATHARFWLLDDDGRYRHAACIGLRPNDNEPCELERSVAVKSQPVRSDTEPYWLVVPARSGQTNNIVGLLTLVSTNEEFSADDIRVAERIGVQAAVAIDNARMHEMLRLQATRDGLTGLPNHRSMQDALTKMLEEAYGANMPLGLALLDIDNFKRVNDTYGHQIGDEAIKALGKVLHHGIGGMGMAARYGGEEFVVLMPGCDAAASCRIADRLREDVTHIEVPLPDGGVLKFTASFGVSNVDQYQFMVENADMLKSADMGLYKAKRTGKNKVVLATPDMEMEQMTDAEKAALAAREKGEAAAGGEQAAA